MKDLKHYFIDKTCKKTSINSDQFTASSINDVSENSIISSGKKRKRVKIKISKTITNDKVCNIVESKNDLIDKTPSPLNKNTIVHKLKKSTSIIDDTPKKSTDNLNSNVNDKSLIQKSNNSIKNYFTSQVSLSQSQSDKSNILNEIFTDDVEIFSNKRKIPIKSHKETEDEILIDNKKVIKNSNKLVDENKIKTNSSLICSLTKSTKNLDTYFTMDSQMDIEKKKIKNEKLLKKTINSDKNIEYLDGKTSNILKFDTLQNLSENILTNTQESSSSQHKTKWSLRINLQATSDISKKDKYVKMKEKNLKKRKKKKKKHGIKCQDNEKIKLEIDNDILHMENSKKNLQIIECKDKIKDNSCQTNENSEIKLIDKTNMKRRIDEKLAPLFVKKPKIDPEVMEARRIFLHSQSAKKDDKIEVKEKPEMLSTVLPFPLISHISQIESIKKIETITKNINFKYKFKENYTHPSNLDVNNLKLLLNLNTFNVKNKENNSKSIKVNTDVVLKEIQVYCSDVKSIWNTILSLSNKNIVTKKRTSFDRKKNVESTIEKINNKYDIWTYKYRPLNSKQMIGNEEAALKLKNWLITWQAPSNKNKDEDSDGFYSSDSGTNTEYNNQVAVLLGPHGSGKTASVYAIANELGYNVLEINASSKRTGRIILKEFEEATKSHRVKHSENSLPFEIIKKKNEKKKISQNSLILFDDVDIIFDEDDGFISAVYQLATNTKRPIVMTSKDSCLNLKKMAPSQHIIHFQKTMDSRVSALLELITLAESGTRLSPSILNNLIMNGDLRNALLQLQFLLITEAPLDVPRNYFQTLWQDMKNCIYKSTFSKVNKKEMKKIVSRKNNIKIIKNLADDLDTICLISSLIQVDDDTIDICKLKFEPSLSLVENVDLFSNNNNQSMEISKWLSKKVMFKNNNNNNFNINNIDVKLTKTLLMKKKVDVGIDLALSKVSMYNIDSQSIINDYLPTIRNICRAEETKVSNNLKRKNRYYHYLQGLQLPSYVLKPTILQAACKIFQDKSFR